MHSGLSTIETVEPRKQPAELKTARRRSPLSSDIAHAEGKRDRRQSGLARRGPILRPQDSRFRLRHVRVFQRSFGPDCAERIARELGNGFPARTALQFEKP